MKLHVSTIPQIIGNSRETPGITHLRYTSMLCLRDALCGRIVCFKIVINALLAELALRILMKSHLQTSDDAINILSP